MSVLMLWRYLLVLLFLVQLGFGQTHKPSYLERPVTLQEKKQNIKDLFQHIADQTGVVFSYAQTFNDKQTISISCKNKSLRLVLNEIFKNSNCTYKLKDKYIIIKCSEKPKPQTNIVLGYIYNAVDSTRIGNTSIYVKKTKQVVLSDEYGFFSLSYAPEQLPMEVSVAKEKFRDTSFILESGNQQNLFFYLVPKMQQKEQEPEIVMQNSYDTLKKPLGDTILKRNSNLSAFWREFGKANENLKNISDTLFNDFSISLFPPISTNRLLSINTENKVALNILVGYSKGISAFEIGGLLNIDNGNVRGVQIAGLGNSVSGSLNGVQIGGLFNLVQKQTIGVELAGIFNLNKTSVKGTQIAGIGNVIKGNVEGMQIAGVFNLAQNTKGIQLAGIFNVTDTTEGIQIAGVLNSSKYLIGTQIALLNMNDSALGVPIGLFSYVKKGYHKIELSVDEVGFLSFGLGSGVNKFHNIFMIGYNYRYPEIWTYGYGLGSTVRLSKSWGLHFNLSGQQLQAFGTEVKANILFKAVLAVELNAHQRIQVGIGPTLNVFTADTHDKNFVSVYENLAPYTFYETFNEGRKNSIWAGGKLYIKFL